MSPETSIIILTVFAGAGQGLFAFLVAGDALGLLKGAPLSAETMIGGVVVSLLFTIAGAVASVFHLGRPERALKAVKQWRVSWLSLEAVILPVFQGLAVVYGACAWFGLSPGLRLLFGALGVAAAIALYIASGMIYAEVRFIREWSTAYTPVNFTLIGLVSGGTAAVGALEIAGAAPEVTLGVLRAVFGFTLIGMIAKLLFYRKMKALYSPFSLQSAIGVTHPQIQMMDMGASYDHYNTIEFAYKGHRGKRETIRAASIVLLFVAPMVLMMVDYMPLLHGGFASLMPVAALFMIAGALLERWLFFVDGNHAQNLYYGTFIEKGAANPLLQPDTSGAPVPPR